MKKILKVLLVCLLCFLSIGILYGLYAIIVPWITEYNPEENTVILESGPMNLLPADRDYSILSWNIGYAGLGGEMDFFYEGGRMTRPEEQQSQKYLAGITAFLEMNDSIDFMFIQEVDFRSKRSYRVDQYMAIQGTLAEYHGVSATNYKSAFVPSPALAPMGKVHAGLATFGRHSAANATRVSTPGSYAWPMRLFMLKRCFLVSRYRVGDGRFLVLFNIHNSAFDDAADLRDQELQLLRKLAMEEYEKGNYVVIGGDWNQNPPGWEPRTAVKYQVKNLWPIDKQYFPAQWTWAFDPGLPTNREVSTPFDPEGTNCTLLDFFLVSPNVKVESVKTIDLEFKYSDHLPVVMRFRLM
jgi:endonuclease/exonuclease/phosphatase family metal-dependent hydrolase